MPIPRSNRSWMDRYLYSTLVVQCLSKRFNSEIVTGICQFSQYLGKKLHMLFKIVKSVEIVIILGKTTIFYPWFHAKIVYCCLCPHKFTFSGYNVPHNFFWLYTVHHYPLNFLVVALLCTTFLSCTLLHTIFFR